MREDVTLAPKDRETAGRFSPDQCLFLDLELAEDGSIREVGALLGDRSLHLRAGRRRAPLGRDALDELERFATGARSVAGHNLVGFDLPSLARLHARSFTLSLPAIDTLLLSPLAFPRKPYHALVKDYKLVADAANDPVADARLCRTLLADEEDALSALARSDPLLLACHRSALTGWEPQDAVVRAAAGGTAGFLAQCGAAALSDDDAVGRLAERFRGHVCATAWDDAARSALADSANRPAFAFAVAWIASAETRSVLPPWVARNFSAVVALVQRLREQPCSRRECTWCAEVHDPARQLRSFFGFDSFRGDAQEQVVRLGFSGRPHLAVLPTSYGKSLCYQLPALARYRRTGALTVVISPLQALMKDQVDVLETRVRGNQAVAIQGMLTPPERAEALARVRDGDVALLYVAPEQLRNRSFQAAIAMRTIGCWVFDEAHCLSKWGHDFRTDYHHAARFLREFSERTRTPVPPVACFTATARRDVSDEIRAYFRNELGQELALVEVPPGRPELTYSVREVTDEGRLSVVDEEIRARLAGPGKAIVYLSTRRRTQDAAQFLEARGWAASAFHAGLEVTQKRAVQDAFRRGDLRVVCATNAFGMGIDEPDVRLVVHADIPASLENYLQEAGRAGRDGRPAHCALLFQPGDLDRQFDLLARSRLTRRDIAQILGAVRRCRRGDAPVVATAGELLHDDRTDVSFDADDRDARTKVFTAVSWLERGGFLLRDENHTRVFQGRPRVADLVQARARMEELGLPEGRRRTWESVLTALFQADARDGLDIDELADSAGVRAFGDDSDHAHAAGRRPSAAERLLRILRDMVRQGLLEEGTFLTAFVRQGIADPSEERLRTLDTIETETLAVLRELAPDLAPAPSAGLEDESEAPSWAAMDLCAVNGELMARGCVTVPETLRRIVFALAQDGRRFGEGHGVLDVRHRGGEQYRIRLRLPWEKVVQTSEIRRRAAHAVLWAILSKARDLGRGEVLASFGLAELGAAVKLALSDRTEEKAEVAAERALLYLHELRVLTLQRGLSLFRQAMGLRLLPQAHARGFGVDDYRLLAEHYDERTAQVHIAGEYARLGAGRPGAAGALVDGYFGMERNAFLTRFFEGRSEEIARKTSAGTYARIVDELGNRTQQRIVTGAPGEDVLVLAGPGSGKTRVIVHRCAWLLHVQRVPASSILVLCFNRAAAHEIRVRLRDLAGEASNGVGVFTYHALALRLTGRTFERDAATREDVSADRAFDGIVRDANRLLRGEIPAAGLAPDELRERLLSGIEHVLVDEYQDVDEEQYELLSALAGRKGSCGAREERARLLAVGDDDQNIYGWRRADARYLRQFREDYDARVVHLVDNYRSTAHIVAAANLVIAPAPDRMKTSHAIRVAKSMRERGRGGEIAQFDRVSRGRVQVFQVPDRGGQVATLAAELSRLRTILATSAWSDFAVLARTNRELDAVRAWCESAQVPVRRRVLAGAGLPLRHLREIAGALDLLGARRPGEILGAEDVRKLLGVPAAVPSLNPWLALLHRTLEDWRAELDGGTAPAAAFAEFLHEALADQRRGSTVGDGLFLGTVHGAKGLEFDHVFVLDGDPPSGRDGDSRSVTEVAAEERRTYYVAMTRARASLHLFRRADISNPMALEAEAAAASGDRAFRLSRGHSAETLGREVLATRYLVLGMREVDLGFAGRRTEGSEVHRRIATLATGTPVFLRREGDRVGIFDAAGGQVGALSEEGRRAWEPRLDTVRQARVFALLFRERDLTAMEWRDTVHSAAWEVPLLELLVQSG